MNVYVRNHDGAALMPCSQAKARKLLQASKAKIVAYRPFTIQLGWQCEGQTQEITCGIDKGSTLRGLPVSATEEWCWQPRSITVEM